MTIEFDPNILEIKIRKMRRALLYRECSRP